MSTVASSRFATSANPARKGVLARLMAWDASFRQRGHLARLDDAALRDMGLTARDVQRELRRPVWEAPDHWTR